MCVCVCLRVCVRGRGRMCACMLVCVSTCACVHACVPPTPSVSIMSIRRSLASTSRGVKVVCSGRSRVGGRGSAGAGGGSLGL